VISSRSHKIFYKKLYNFKTFHYVFAYNLHRFNHLRENHISLIYIEFVITCLTTMKQKDTV